jgi:hypothetical protein
MRRIVTCGTLVVCMTVGMIVCSNQTIGQTKSNLIEQTIELHLNRGTLLQALSKLSVNNRVPIGFVPTLAHKDDHNLNIDVDNATLKTVLDTIVQQHSGYRWEVRDGVINILPTNSADDFVENFLGTPIHNFDPPKLPGSSRLRDAITELPEVQILLKANGISASHYGSFERYPSLYSNPNVDLSMSNTDVRGILNKIVRESEHKMWIVSRSGKNLTSLDIGF